MTSQILTPNGEANGGTDFTIVGGAATRWQAVSSAVGADTGDTSYIKRTHATASKSIRFDCTAFTVPANTVLTRMRIIIKQNRPASAKIVVSPQYDVPGLMGPGGWLIEPHTQSFGWATFEGTSVGVVTDYSPWFAFTDQPIGGFAQTLVNGLKIGITDQATASGRITAISEVSLEVEYTTRPTAAVTAPTGTVTATAVPPITWSYSDTESDPQAAYQARVYTDAQLTAAGSATALFADTTTYPPVYDSGLTAGTATSHTPVVGLPLTGTYRALVVVAQAHPAGGYIYGDAVASSVFTMNVDGPPAPEASAAWVPATASATLTVQGLLNMLTANQASLETDLTGWTAGGTNCTLSRSTTKALIGSASLRMSSTAAGDMRGAFGAGSRIKVNPGQSVTAGINFSAGSVGRSCRARLVFFQADGVTACVSGSVVDGSLISDTTGGWTQAKVVATAPADAGWVDLVPFVLATGGAAELHYADKMSLHPTNAAQTVVWSPGGYTISGYRVDCSDLLSGMHQLVAADQVTQRIVVSDYSIARGLALTYSVAMVAVIDGVSVTGPAVTPGVTTVNDGLWWFKVDGQPAMNVGAVFVLEPEDTEVDEQMGIFRPIDTDEDAEFTPAIKVSGAIGGDDGTYAVVTRTPAEWVAFEPIYRSQGAVLVQDPYGTQKWVEWTSRRQTRSREPARERHDIGLGYVNVATP